MDTIIIHSAPSKTKAITKFLKAIDVSFELKEREDAYDPEFVEMVLERSKNAKEGKATTINPNDLWGSLGLK